MFEGMWRLEGRRLRGWDEGGGTAMQRQFTCRTKPFGLYV